MRGTHRAMMVPTMCVLGVISGVPGFAQTNIAQVIAAADAASYRAVREYVADKAVPLGPLIVPSNIVAPQSYRALMQRMLQRSFVFRRQCQRIANRPDLVVRVASTEAGSPLTRARTNIAKQSDGTLLAMVHLGAREDYVELIAHEFEHIVEQLDGVDLAARSRLGSTGVSRASFEANAFETERAKRVGMMVWAEVQRGDR